MSFGYGQSPVLGRVGGKLVQGNRDCLSNVRSYQQFRTVNTRASLSVWAVGRKLLLDQTVKLGSGPARFHEQPVDVRERLDASLYCVLEAFGRVGMGKMHCRLHGGQHIPGSVLGFAGENGDLRLAAFALRYVLEAVDGTDNVSIAIPDWLDVNERDATRRSMWTSCSRTETPVRSTSAMGQ